jgi:hypothetical protein
VVTTRPTNVFAGADPGASDGTGASVGDRNGDGLGATLGDAAAIEGGADRSAAPGLDPAGLAELVHAARTATATVPRAASERNGTEMPVDVIGEPLDLTAEGPARRRTGTRRHRVVPTPWSVADHASTPPARSNAVCGSIPDGCATRANLADVQASKASRSRSRLAAVAAPGCQRVAVAANRRPTSSSLSMAVEARSAAAASPAVTASSSAFRMTDCEFASGLP